MGYINTSKRAGGASREINIRNELNLLQQKPQRTPNKILEGHVPLTPDHHLLGWVQRATRVSNNGKTGTDGCCLGYCWMTAKVSQLRIWTLFQVRVRKDSIWMADSSQQQWDHLVTQMLLGRNTSCYIRRSTMPLTTFKWCYMGHICC